MATRWGVPLFALWKERIYTEKKSTILISGVWLSNQISYPHYIMGYIHAHTLKCHYVCH